MLFITNRTPKQSNRTRLNRKISFDLHETCASQYMYFCERKSEDDYVEIGSKAFFNQLKNLPDKTQILFYIHGFNNTGEKEIFPRANRLQELIDEEGGKDLVYVVPLIWPCDDDRFYAIVDDYWDDQDAADLSGVAFARLLGKFETWRTHKDQMDNPCYKRINVLAHSMGNRVLQNALNKWAGKYNNGQIPLLFRNIFMVAADVKNDTLEDGKMGMYIPDAARNVVVYFAKDDMAMPASKVANLKHRSLSKRMGMTGPADINLLPNNVYQADCDNFNNYCNYPQGHSYFLDCPGQKKSPVLKHIAKAIATGRVQPDQRHIEFKKP